MAVTVATGWPRTIVNGNMREKLWRLTVEDDADTLTTGLSIIKHVAVDGSDPSHPVDATVSGGTITFQTDGTEDTAVFVRAIGW